MLAGGNSNHISRYPASIPHNSAGVNYGHNPTGGYNSRSLAPNMMPPNNTGAPMLRSLFNGQQQPQHNVRVRFEKLAFYELMADLGGPSLPIKLAPVNAFMKPYTNTFTFMFTVEQANLILAGRETIQGRVEFRHQVHLRFGYYDSQTAQRDVLPPNLVVNVNQKPAILPTPKPTSKPNSDIIRPGRSIDISPQLKIAPNSANKVDLTWSDEKVSISRSVL
jgi:hypothetical protein